MYPVVSYCDAKNVDVVDAHDDGSEMALIPVSVICNPVVDVGFMYIVGLDDESGLLLDGDCVVVAGVAFVGAGEEEEITLVVVGFVVGELVVGAATVVVVVGAGVVSSIGCTVGVPVVNDATVGVPVVGTPVVEMLLGCRVVGVPVVVPILPVVVGVPVVTDGLSVVGEFVVGETVGLLEVTTVGANVLAIGAAVVTTVVGGGVATVVAGTVGLGVGTSIIDVLRNVGGSDDVALVTDGDGELVSCAIMMLPLLKVHTIKTSMNR